jgi:hypothetical protein
MILSTAYHPTLCVVGAAATLALGLAGCSSPMPGAPAPQPSADQARLEPAPRPDMRSGPVLPETARVQNRIIVKLRSTQDGQATAVIAALRQATLAQVTYLHSITPNTHLYTFTTTQPMLAADLVKRVQQWTEVEYAEADRPMQLIR